MTIIEYESYQEKKAHVNAAFPYTTYPCSIPLDFPEVPPHWHEEMEIIYIKKGSGIISVDFKDFTVSEGTLLFIGLLCPASKRAADDPHRGHAIPRILWCDLCLH